MVAPAVVPTPPRVVLVAGKRGHYYLAARALHGEGALARFVTSTFFKSDSWRRFVFPRRRVAVRTDAALDAAPVVSLWPVELGYRAATAVLGRRHALQRAYNRVFDWCGTRMQRTDGDVFHVANTYAHFGAPAARRRGMKVVVDQQSVHPAFSRTRLHAEHDRLGIAPPERDYAAERGIARELELADRILVPSRFVFEENLKAGLPAAQQRIVPIGVDTRLFHPADRRERAARTGPLRILFVGTLSASKGLGTLLDAAEQLGPTAVTVRAIGTCRAEARRLLEGRRINIDVKPPMPHARLATEYRAADICCLPSFLEGSSLVNYEAMASGLPCITTTTAGSVIQQDHDGILIDPGDEDALVAALQRLVDSREDQEELAQNARRTACRWDVAGYGKRLLEAYASLLAE